MFLGLGFTEIIGETIAIKDTTLVKLEIDGECPCMLVGHYTYLMLL